LKENNINTVLHLGDVFDVRKNIDYLSLKWAKDVVFTPLKEMGASLVILAGNHDSFYKNTNEVNSPSLLLHEYDNITVVSEIETLNIGGRDICFIPWINTENYNGVMEHIKETPATIAMGHLQISGYIAHQGYVCEEGIDRNIFSSKFSKTFSGHFHHKNGDGKILYLGNPYQMYWNDYGDTRGFHIFDTKTTKLDFIPNPYQFFYKIFYDDTQNDYYEKDLTCYKGTNIKLVVEKKKDLKQFDYLVSQLQDISIDLKIIEELFDSESLPEDFELEHEDTLMVLEKCVDDYSEEYDINTIKNIMKSLYKEAIGMS
jgi:DNA repair exonuclease SbcCD nuclease subunit